MGDPPSSSSSSSSLIPALAKLASLAVFLSIGYSFVSSASQHRLNPRRQRRPSSFTSSSSSPSPNQDLRRSVIVIGGGFSGLAAATRLHSSGFSVIILEGLDRIGGRAWTHRVARLERPGTKEDLNFELGAQWLHGTVGHPLFPVAEDHGLLEGRAIHQSDFRQRWVRIGGGGEKEGGGEEGERKVAEERIRKVLDWLDEFADEFSAADHPRVVEMEHVGVRDVGAYFRRRLKEKQAEELDLLNQQKKRQNVSNGVEEGEATKEGEKEEEEARERQRYYEELDLEILQWREAFEDTITSADNCAQVSLRHFHEYHTLEGEHTLIPKGYQRIAEILASQLPQDSVRLNHTVSRIVYHPERDDFPRVVCTNGAEFEADHVVVTLPLGVMKERAAEIFEPALPAAKLFAVSRLGFGVVDKLYFEFPAEYDCHKLGGCGFLWPVNPKGPTWVQKIFTLHMVSTNSIVLWLSGEAARQMESLPEAQVVQDVLQVLREHFDPNIPAPKNVLRANWYNNEFFRGSYTFVPVGASGNDIDSLAEPLCEKATGVPRVLFAGEATHRYFYSTTHGAFLSGEREAKRIIECEE